MRRATKSMALVGLLACGPVAPGSDDTGAVSSTSGSSPTSGAAIMSGAAITSGAASTGGTTELVGGTTEDPPAGTMAGTSSDSGHDFLVRVDGVGDGSCNPFTQNCPPGEKCMPYADDGGGSWNNDKCVPVMENPVQVGEPCFAEGGGTSGVDNCDLGLMCWAVDARGMGQCVELCSGSLELGTCDTPCTVCAVSSLGTLNLCLAGCDPVLQNCDPSDVCIGIPNAEGFLCVLDASGDEGQVHETCSFANACDPGLVCSDPAAAVECDQDADGCCEPYCDLSDPDADMKCPGVGQVCTPYFEDGTAPPCWQHAGYCTVPM